MEWLLFAIGVAVVGVVGIGLGLIAGRAWAHRVEPRPGDGAAATMTPVESMAATLANRDDPATGPVDGGSDELEETMSSVDGRAGRGGVDDDGGGKRRGD